MRKMKRRGVSEVIATLIMVAVTIAGFSVYFAVAGANLRLGASVPISELQTQAVVVNEQVQLAYSTIGASSVSLYLFSYGTSPVTFNTIVFVWGANNVRCTMSQPLAPNILTEVTIPGGAGTCFATSGLPTSPMTITAISSDGNLFTWRA
jgi:flagellin-like protein